MAAWACGDDLDLCCLQREKERECSRNPERRSKEKEKE